MAHRSSRSTLQLGATVVPLARVQKLVAQMATLLHHIQPWMQKSIAESEDRMERRMEGMMDRKAELVSLRTDIDAILAFPSVEPQVAPTALAYDMVLDALFSGTAEEGLAPTHAKGKRHRSHRTKEEKHKIVDVAGGLGGKALTSFEPQNTVTNPKLWQFRGKNPEAWIVQAEHYFHLYKKEYESIEGRFTNLMQLPYVIEYRNCCVDSFGESDVLFPSHTYVHPQWSNITNSLLSQHHGEQSECKSNTNARKVFGESSDRHKDAHSLGTSSKPIELFLPPNDIVSSISKVNSCGEDVKNEDKNDEEEIVSIRNKPIELVNTNADKHSFWINSIVSSPCSLSIFYICKALDDRWNQLFANPFGLALRWEVMTSFPSTFNHAKLMSKVTNDVRDYVGCFIIFSLDMHPELIECDGYDLKCLVSRSNLVGNGIILHVWDSGIHRQLVKLNHLNSGILFHTQTQDILVNAKQLKRPFCVLTVHQRKSFLVGGAIEE
ncbi:hypothetical protein MTR67_001559 [Solanum verrucosum]|uniref:Uncharacterized protein n=1 Tax=Solanum verrucosum TaxID=315347 RepID=A0AAF0PNG5_SOLVR|nr:hypothetical protein MTR67_001559 [Solanum verrucosum]